MVTKDQLLLYLKEKSGSWISGELLSNKLTVSRTAVWKHVRKLKEEGYVIESSPRKGYLFRKSSDVLTPNEIGAGLDTRIFRTKNIVCLKEIDATNMRAKDLAGSGAPEGTVVIAETQTMGRGRKGRTWFSPYRDGIYVSIILRPGISPSAAPRMTLMAAVAVAEALDSLLQLKVRIKWPNDILVNNRKLAGILTEISMEMDEVEYMVVGLGLNVNTPAKSFPGEIREKATSILIETGERSSRVDLIRAYLKCYDKYYEIPKKSGFEPIMKRWKEFSDIIGRRVAVDVIGKKHVGSVVDIDNDGVLILKDDQARFHRIFSGDVCFTRT